MSTLMTPCVSMCRFFVVSVLSLDTSDRGLGHNIIIIDVSVLRLGSTPVLWSGRSDRTARI